jgi:hypothetical protein
MSGGRTTRLALGFVVLLVIVAVVVILAARGSTTQRPAPVAVVSPTSASAPTPVFTPAPGHSGPARLYPDPSLTPGDVFTDVTAQQVCTPGYSSKVRNVSQSEKTQVYRRYGEANVPGKAEVDHFISLELGGSNALTNLWPETYNPVPGAHEKDKVENYLHAQVCSGAMTLAQAQQVIAADWYAVYQQIANK